MSFFALPNLVSSAVTPCVPWTFTSSSIPDEVRSKEGKKARDKWISDPTTKHQVYSAVEGVHAGLRVSEAKGTDEGNPPLKIHAFVADIDAPVTEDELATGIGRLGNMIPNYFERTLSGNARLIWLFEQPVLVPSAKFATEFLKYALQKGRFEQVAAALDKPAWESPTRMYTNSGDWRVIDADARVSHTLLQGWVVEVAEKHAWKKERGSLEIPLPVVWTELQKKYPEAVSWQSDFVEGAQGPTFWVQGSASPKSAIVKPTGIYTFSAHATKPFYSWADLLGKDFTDKYAAEQLGKAVEGIYHDGQSYYMQDGYNNWKAFSKEDIVLHLSTTRGLSTVKDQGLPSEVSRALVYLQTWHGVEGAAPFVFQPPGPLKRNGTAFLNTATRKVLTPASGQAVWGPEGQFPFISKLLDTLFHPDSSPTRPKDYFLSWLAYAYQGAYHYRMRQGQILLLLGGTGIGKTFLSQGLFPLLFGGAAEAQDYLLGHSQFNSQLFECGFWNIDDNSLSLDGASHRKWSAMGKKMAANSTFAYHKKFRSASYIEWTGRLFVTANDDEKSSRIVPDLSMSLLDKIMLFRAVSTPQIEFPDRVACEQIIRDEAPWFARFLLDFVIPEHCAGSSRFGVKSYHDATLVRTADHSSSTASFAEILDEWRRGWFSDNPTMTKWVGNSTKLLMAMHNNELLATSALRSLSPREILRQLVGLKSKGLPWLATEDEGTSGNSSRIWIVYKPEKPAFKSSLS